MTRTENAEDWAFERGQREVLEHIARGVALHRVLTDITLLIEKQQPGMLCSILLLDNERGCLRHGAAPSLPEAYVRAIDGSKIGPQAGSCGTAAYLRERVIVEDIASHPYWVSYKDIALLHGLRACWSSPIFSSTREVMGTFAMYFREPRAPQAYELHWVERATHLAAVAIERDRTGALLRTAEQQRQIVFDGINDVVFSVSVEPEGVFRFQYINAPFLKATGLREGDVVGQLVSDIIPEPSRTQVLANYQTCIRGRRTVTWDEVSIYPAGTKYGEVSISPVFDLHGVCVTLLGTVHDITERKRTEARLLRVERMESLGRLAGNIAHDFNNILSAVLANAQLGMQNHGPTHSAHPFFANIEEAGNRAAQLVRQILTFSRDQPPNKEVVDLGAVTEEALRLLRVTRPRAAMIEAHFAGDVPQILADSTQMHQVIMNLCTNALHSLPEAGGAVNLRIERVTLEHNLVESTGELAAGAYAVLTVEDTGSGMDEATLEHIFDPFFTTKIGKGTGLGLSVVHGIVKSHNGGIIVRSSPGKGTVFKVYFPIVER